MLQHGPFSILLQMIFSIVGLIFFNIGSSGFPVCPRCPRFHLAPPNGALAKQIATDCSLSVHDVRFRLAPSQRSSLQALRAISHSFLPVQNTQRGISGIKPPQVLTEGFNAEIAISGLIAQIGFVYLVIFMQKDGLKGCVLDQLLPSHLWPLRLYWIHICHGAAIIGLRLRSRYINMSNIL